MLPWRGHPKLWHPFCYLQHRDSYLFVRQGCVYSFRNTLIYLRRHLHMYLTYVRWLGYISRGSDLSHIILQYIAFHPSQTCFLVLCVRRMSFAGVMVVEVQVSSHMMWYDAQGVDSCRSVLILATNCYTIPHFVFIHGLLSSQTISSSPWKYIHIQPDDDRIYKVDDISIDKSWEPRHLNSFQSGLKQIHVRGVIADVPFSDTTCPHRQNLEKPIMWTHSGCGYCVRWRARQ